MIQIVVGPGAWGTWGFGAITLDGIRSQLGALVAEKETRLPGYRAKLPGSPLWLILYSTWDVTRGVPMPHGIGEWAFPSGFDRVFFYAAQNDCVEEIRKA